MDGTNEHLADLERELTRVLSPLMTIDAISVTTTTRTGAPVNLGRLGPDAVPVSVTGYGWGPGLERQRVHLLTGYDTTQTVRISTADGLGLVEEMVARDTEIVKAGHDAGLTEPLHGAALESTAHLVADRDAIAAIIAWAGSPGAARNWIQDALKRRREHLEKTPHAWGDRGMIHVLLDHLHVTYDLVEQHPTDLRVEDGKGYLWAGPVVRVVHALPDTVKTACIGRPLGDVLAETPVGHRIVTGVEADVTDDGASLMMLEPAWKRLDDLLPPMPRGSAPL